MNVFNFLISNVPEYVIELSLNKKRKLINTK